MDAVQKNQDLEFERNKERFQFLKVNIYIIYFVLFLEHIFIKHTLNSKKNLALDSFKIKGIKKNFINILTS